LGNNYTITISATKSFTWTRSFYILRLCWWRDFSSYDKFNVPLPKKTRYW
jgi:hypothetical protein